MPDHFARETRQANRKWNALQIVGHKRNISGFKRHIRASAAHCNSNRGHGQRGRVIHAVAHHANGVIFFQQRFHAVDLVLGQKFRFDFVNANVVGNGLRHAFAIACEHDDGSNIQRVQKANGFGGLGARAIRKRDETQNFFAATQHDNGVATGVVLRQSIVHCVTQRRAAFAHKPRGTHFNYFSRHSSRYALAFNGAYIFGGGNANIFRLRGAHNGARNGVLAALLNSAGCF